MPPPPQDPKDPKDFKDRRGPHTDARDATSDHSPRPKGPYYALCNFQVGKRASEACSCVDPWTVGAVVSSPPFWEARRHTKVSSFPFVDCELTMG